VLLAPCDRALEAGTKARVHPDELIARPVALLLVAGLAGRGGELATSVAWLLMALVVWHAGNSLQDPQRTPADGSLASR
jgi:hypothetical protein